MKVRYLLLAVLFLFMQRINAEIIAISGIYNGLNLYVENAFNGGVSCVKSVFVNETKVTVDVSAAFFEIDLSHLKLESPVSVTIIYLPGCHPKILNADVINIGGGFKFTSVNMDMHKIQWATTKEKHDGKFLIEQLIDEKWKAIAELPGKAHAIINMYELTLPYQKGAQYRIVYKESEGAVYFSKSLECKDK